MLLQWLCHTGSTCSGVFGHYYMKCCLDRLFAVKHINTGIVSWWPTLCPSYRNWYKKLHANGNNFNEEERFQILCVTYCRLNSKRTCTFPEALAQTCWSMKDDARILKLT